MLVSYYLPQTRSLLQLPGTESTSLYSDADLTRWINIARGQVAGEGECIRVIGTIDTIAGQQAYTFGAVDLGLPSATGVQGIINIRSMSCSLGAGQAWMAPRAWPWFSLYNLNTATPQQGIPTEWAQFGQGAAPGTAGSQASVNGGSFYVSLTPDNVYQLNCNSVCYPIPLADDNDPEALPYMWTDAVPFFAAYFALLSAQTNARMADAATMYKGHYNEFMTRARQQANPDVNRWLYAQGGDPAQSAKFGTTKGAAQ